MALFNIGTGEKTALDKLKRLKKDATDARRPYDAEAWLNLAFFNGEQYVEWHPKIDNIRRIPRKKGEEDVPRPVFNKIQSYIYTAQSETLQDKPSADVLPPNDDWSSEIDADVNKGYLNWIMEPTVANWDRQLSRATLWALISPAGWLKWVWDPELGRPDIMPVPFFDFAVDPYALGQADFARARYGIHSQFMAPEMASDIYGIDVKDRDIEQADSMRSELLRGMGSNTVSRGITVHELWMRPTKKAPGGMYAVFTDRHLITLEDLPYQHLKSDGGRLPFTMLGSLERADSMYYSSPVTALRASQMVWNKFIQQSILINDAFANPKWWIPLELDMKEMPNSSPRQILRGNAGNTGLKPEIITPGNTTNMQPLLDSFEQQMMHVVAVHEVSQGQVPGRVEAAKAIELLQSSDKGRYAHLLGTIDQTISEGFWQVLMLARQFEKPERQVTIYSREGLPLVKRWRRDHVTPGTRIRVVRMSGLGRTRAQRYETLMNLWTQGIIRDPDVMAELLEVPVPSFTNTRMQDMRLARMETIEMSEGVAVTPNSWDNHSIHIREHNEYRKTAEFRALSDETKSKFEYHVEKHENFQLIQAMKQARLMMAQQGMLQAPGGQPGDGAAQPGQAMSPGAPAGTNPTEAAPEPSNTPMYFSPAQGPGSYAARGRS